jgi:hypothetical protein
MNRVRSGILINSKSGTKATHARGPKSTGVKLPHNKPAVNNETAQAPRDGARSGWERAASMICSTVKSPDLGLGDPLAAEVFGRECAEVGDAAGMISVGMGPSILGLMGTKRRASW